ncbi:GTF2I repeat domain containing 2 [Chelydra serpentina]|uniref:GTF2I repeat domain containing 2 n=1 Tax=Chelydra serpentina TaxID=8475 RepID=A0A8T1S6P5_CHESE|nr:GTF2I repeat domain containing 2 [Chelydra serpentina]
MHYEKYDAFTGKIRGEKVRQLKAAFAKQRNFFSEINKSSQDSVRTSFVISEMIAKSRPFTEGLFVKECLVKASEILCPDRKKVFEGISLSATTVACRITDRADNVQKQLIQMAKDFEAFSIALDESTDVSDATQCAVLIRGVDCNLNITEELLDLMSLKGTRTGRDIFQGLEECIQKAALPWNQLASLATDGAPSMCSENFGVVELLKTKLNCLNIPGINQYTLHFASRSPV